MKYCKVFGVLFVSLLVFISCSDDDKPDVPVGDTADRIGVVSKADFDKYVVGKYWKISERAFFDSDGMATDERLSGTFGGTVAQYFSDVNIYSDYFDAGPVAEKPIQGQYYYIKDNPFSYDEKTGDVIVQTTGSVGNYFLFYVEYADEGKLVALSNFGWMAGSGETPNKSYVRATYVPMTDAEVAELESKFVAWPK